MSRIFRIVSAACGLLMLLGAAGTRAEANTIYTVDRIVFAPFVTVTGELVTDGTVGPLESPNFVDWNLTVESILGAETLLGYVSGQNSQLAAFGGLTATPDGLFFDFGQAGLLWITNSALPHIGSYWCLDSFIAICSVEHGETVGSMTALEGFRSLTGVQQIATVKATTGVPEPASVLLLAAGVLGFLRRRYVAAGL